MTKGRITPTTGVTADGWVSVGVVQRAHGLQGSLKIHLWNDDGDALRAGLDVKIGARVYKARAASSAGKSISLEGILDRDAAEALAGQELFVRREDFPDAKDDEAYLIDLVDAEVVDEQGKVLGVVDGFADNTAQPLLAVRTDVGNGGAGLTPARTREPVLVPFVPAIVIEVDHEAKRIVLRPPPGLFELDDAANDSGDEGER